MAKTGAERQREYQQRHPARERAKAARYRKAERRLREKYRSEYERLIDDRLPTPQRYREAVGALKIKHPKIWKQILADVNEQEELNAVA